MENTQNSPSIEKVQRKRKENYENWSICLIIDLNVAQVVLKKAINITRMF